MGCMEGKKMNKKMIDKLKPLRRIEYRIMSAEIDTGKNSLHSLYCFSLVFAAIFIVGEMLKHAALFIILAVFVILGRMLYSMVAYHQLNKQFEDEVLK